MAGRISKCSSAVLHIRINQQPVHWTRCMPGLAEYSLIGVLFLIKPNQLSLGQVGIVTQSGSLQHPGGSTLRAMLLLSRYSPA
jgi:hypothetical protein